MYVNYSTVGSAALPDQAELSLLVWVFCFVLLLVCFLCVCVRDFLKYQAAVWVFP